MNDINKLPRWAKLTIEKLEADKEYYKKRNEKRVEHQRNGTGKVVLTDMMEEIILNDDDRVRFKINDQYIDCQLNLGLNKLEIYSSGNLKISPRSTNILVVEVEGYF